MDDEDKFEGDVSRRRAKHTPDTGSMFRPPSAVSSKRVAARARAAWYNRSRGAGAVKLKHERPAGSQRVAVKIHPKVHAKAAGGAGSARHVKRHLGPALEQGTKQQAGKHNAHRVVAAHQRHRNAGKARTADKFQQQLAIDARNLIHAHHARPTRPKDPWPPRPGGAS